MLQIDGGKTAKLRLKSRATQAVLSVPVMGGKSPDKDPNTAQSLPHSKLGLKAADGDAEERFRA